MKIKLTEGAWVVAFEDLEKLVDKARLEREKN